MSECPVHQFSFGPHTQHQSIADIHRMDNPPPNVADFECPVCGLKLFVYYRTVPIGGPYREDEKEGNKK